MKSGGNANGVAFHAAELPELLSPLRALSRDAEISPPLLCGTPYIQ